MNPFIFWLLFTTLLELLRLDVASAAITYLLASLIRVSGVLGVSSAIRDWTTNCCL